jgi:predicted ATPase
VQGKSNFLDALHFVRDALAGSLDNAINERGGLNEVRRRSSGHPTHFGIRIEFRLKDGREGRMPSTSARWRAAGMKFNMKNAVSAASERSVLPHRKGPPDRK